jgi:pimeloyl-ACP methyl ester carboxylesterase
MEQYYVGNEERKLYSVYYEPRPSANNEKAVILCYPIGQEYIRCHRMYSNLAGKLVQEGVHVVKFDYSGTGDSHGEFSAASIDEWVADIRHIAAELRAGTEARQLYIVGVRLGAYLALKYAEQEPVDGMVLLSPVFDGEDFFTEIRKDYRKWLDGSFARQRRTKRGQVECHGFLYSKSLTAAIRNILPSTIRFPHAPMMIIDERISMVGDHSQVSYHPLVNRRLWKKNRGEENKDVLPIHEINLICDWIARI